MIKSQELVNNLDKKLTYKTQEIIILFLKKSKVGYLIELALMEFKLIIMIMLRARLQTKNHKGKWVGLANFRLELSGTLIRINNNKKHKFNKIIRQISAKNLTMMMVT